MARRITLDFLKTEAASGLLIAVAALAGLIVAGSPWAGGYFGFVDAPLTLQAGGFRQTLSTLDWVRHGLMAIFFFVVGLEIKYEILRGELANPRRLGLPVAAALGGVATPALVYLACNLGPGGAPGGWPATIGTDVAVALALLAAAGPRIPASLRTFLLTLAIASDLAAVAVIALVFSADIRWHAVGGAGAALAMMALLGRWGGAPYLFFAACSVLVWAFTLSSGISTSVGAVAAAFMLPIGARKPGRPGVLEDFMESLHPYVAYFILPLFAFCVAGVSLRDLEAVAGPVALGTAAGLLIGKPLGVFGVTAAAVALKWARRPTGATWGELAGVALLCGAGFTMSLYIGDLAFAEAALRAEARLGVAAGSVLAGLAGLLLLRSAGARRPAAA